MDSMHNDINTLKILGSSSMVPYPVTATCLTNLENIKQLKQANEDYYGVFISPLFEDIHNFPLPLDHKVPKFKMFSGEQDPKQYLISFQEEFMLKLDSDERLMKNSS